MKLTTTSIEGYKVLAYTYKATPGMTCRFHLICEVGEPWMDEAKRLTEALCKRRNCHVKKVTLRAAPWYVDALFKNEEPHDHVLPAHGR